MAHSGSHQGSVPDAQIPDTEVIIANTEFEGVSKKNKDLDFVNDWLNVNVTVQNEIWRGERLRKVKPRPYKTENECFVPNINIFGPFNQRRLRKSHLSFKNKASPCSSRSRSTCRRQTSPASAYSALHKVSRNVQTKTKKCDRCPMRIAELAMPTKRQCIETWRCKANVLPELMVERLKQHVMDQTPIVKIPEAIYCFQRGRSVSPKKWLPSKTNHNDAMQPSCQMTTRMLCIVFAHKIAKKLLNPLNITLNSDLERLSKIVSSDIAKIMPQRQCTFRNNQRYQAIHKDVSNKITVWIAGILDDLSLRLLEEELRVKLETEAQIDAMLQLSEQFYTIVETIIQHENKLLSNPFIKSKDLEEEEGPVLDFIDDVIDNVMNVCEPQLQFELESNSSKISNEVLLEEEYVQSQTAVNSSDNKLSKLEETDSSKFSKDVLLDEEHDLPFMPNESSYYKLSKLEEIFIDIEDAPQYLMEESDNSLTNSDYFRNEIGNIINNITKEFANDIESGEISLNSDSKEDINDENKQISSKAEIKYNIDEGNIEQLIPKAEIEHDIDNENIDKVSSKAKIKHNIDERYNKDVIPEAEMGYNIDEGNIEQLTANAEIKHNTDDGNNKNVTPEVEMEHNIYNENIEEVSSKAKNKYNIEDGYNKDVTPEAEMEYNIDEGNIEQFTSDAEIKHNTDDSNNENVTPEVEMEHNYNENIEEVSSKAKNKYNIEDGYNKDVTHTAEMGYNIDEGNIEQLTSSAEIKHNTDDGNNKNVTPEVEMEHNIDNENIDEVSSKAKIKHNIDDGYNKDVTPEAEMEFNIDEGNIEQLTSDAEIKHNTDDSNNENVTPEVEMEHNKDNENIEEVSSKTKIKHIIDDRNNEDVTPEAEMKHNNIEDGNIEKVTFKEEMEQDINDVGISSEAEIKSDRNNAIIDQINDNSPKTENNYESSDSLEKTDSNVSERFEIFTDDSDDDMSSKKVMLSETHLVNPDNSAGRFITSTTEGKESNERLQVAWDLKTNQSAIIFAEPNQNLLSDADESWPADLCDKPMLKVSASTSKSFSSLGKITEKEEKQLSSPDEEEDKVTGEGIGDTDIEVNYIKEKVDNVSPTKKHSTTGQLKRPPKKASTKPSTAKPTTRVTENNQKLIDKNYISKTKNISKTCDVKPDSESSKIESNQTVSRESNLIRSGSDRTEDDSSASPKSKPHVGYDWKVHPKTAPSWVTSWGQGRGEPSEDSSINIKKSTKVTEYELRNWCRELEKAFLNLEIWSNWISTTCKESLLMLRQKEFRCPALAQNSAINRIRHKRDVSKDALLWIKLYQQTETNLKKMKKKYNNVEFASNTATAILNKTVFDVICEFENDCVELHQMIVAAEYRAACTCDKTITRHQK